MNHAAFNNQVEARDNERVEEQYSNVMECLRRPYLLRRQYEQNLALDEFAKGSIRGCVSKGKSAQKRSRESMTSASTSDDESLTCCRTRTAGQSLLNSDDSHSSDCSETSDVSVEDAECNQKVSRDIVVDDVSDAM